jgi:hypothetical protein
VTDILALDLATCTGWTRGKVGAEPVFGSLRFGKSGATNNAVFGNALRWISGLLEPQPRPDIIIVESMLPPEAKLGTTSRDVRDRLAGLHGIIRGVAFLRGIYEIQQASVNDVRGHFIAMRGLKRDEAKAAVMQRCRKLGWLVINDNEADACALWHYAVCLLDPEQALRVSPLFNKDLRTSA